MKGCFIEEANLGRCLEKWLSVENSHLKFNSKPENTQETIRELCKQDTLKCQLR